MTHSPRSLFKSSRNHLAEGRAAARPSAGQVCFLVLSTFCFVLILRNSDAAIEYMGRGLTLCARTVIPSLFPFMVLSELLVASGAGETFGRLFSRMMKWFFGLSGAGVSAVVMGSACGFPVGAKTAVSLYDRNLISKEECEHLLTFTSNPSSAFLITGVGVSLLGNRRLGMILYGVVLGSSFLVGFLARFFLGRQKGGAAHPHFPSGFHPGGIEMFTGAVSGASTAMLTVCGYVIFFSAITGALGCVAGVERLGEFGYAVLSGFLEMTGGISEAVGLSSREASLVLTATIAGWSGLSVHCQVLTLCGGRGLSFRPYLLAKAAQGIVCAGAMMVLLRFGDPRWFSSAEDTLTEAIATVTSWREITVPEMVTDVVFVGGWVLSFAKGGRRM